MQNTPTSKSKRRGRIKRILLLLLLAALLYSTAFIVNIHMTGATDSAEKADVIIVLGAGLRHDGRPGWALTRRSERAADLWHQGIAPLVLCTGAQVEPFPRSEAAACREILTRRGLPESAIVLEEASRSTEESASFSRLILDERGISRTVLVSDSYHMLRATWLFNQQGLTVSASPVPAHRIHYPLFYPYSLLREFVAFHWYLLKETFNLPITHLPGL